MNRLRGTRDGIRATSHFKVKGGKTIPHKSAAVMTEGGRQMRPREPHHRHLQCLDRKPVIDPRDYADEKRSSLVNVVQACKF